MLKLRVLQAEYGDCLLLECGSRARSRCVLVDGGPPSNYEQHLRPELLKMRDAGGKVDLAILSHVDNDHVVGLLDLFAELQQQRARSRTRTIEVDALWHNSFERTLGSAIAARLSTLLDGVGPSRMAMSWTHSIGMGIAEGDRLRGASSSLGIPMNDGFPQRLISVDTATRPIVVGNASLRVVGPTRRNLEELKKEWQAWLRKNARTLITAPALAASADRSVPNPSSIMVLAEGGGRRILLTGDGRGDHLLDGLRQAGFLDRRGALHVDVFKLPHHGSNRNVTKGLFRSVTADRYVISANGKDGNPDLATLIWLVESAKERSRSIRIFATNLTPSIEQLREEYDPDTFGYRLTVLREGAHSMFV